jgi:tetratricopeptide (TPR) repeat protein
VIHLDTTLPQLESAQLVRHAEDGHYLFKHALTQDAAYLSLLQKQRRAIHASVVHVYEELYADRMDEFAPLLAQHALEAGDEVQALNYATRAGDAAARVYANAEAIKFYSQAIHLAERVEKLHSSFTTLQELYLKRGRVYELSDHYADALKNYDAMENFARQHNARKMQLASLVARITIYSIPSPQFDIQRADQLAEHALALARAIDDQPAEAKILWNLMLLNSRLNSNYQQAIQYGEQAIAIARTFDLREQLAYLLNDISLLYVWTGATEQGQAANLEARAMWQAMNNLPMLADNLGYATMQHIALGENESACQSAQEALAICQRIGNVWGETFSQSWVGAAYRELGEIEQAINAMQNSVRLAEHSFRAPLSFTRAELAALYADLGDQQTGLELAHLAYAEGLKIAHLMLIFTTAELAHIYALQGDIATAKHYIADTAQRLTPTDQVSLFDLTIKHVEAEIALAEQDYTGAITICDQVIAFQHAHHLRQHLPKAFYLKACALQRAGKIDQAYAVLQEARVEAEAAQSRWMRWRILAALAQIEQARGNAVPAQQLHTQAHEILDYIVAHTPPAFRESFLNLPAVREVMGK